MYTKKPTILIRQILNTQMYALLLSRKKCIVKLYSFDSTQFLHNLTRKAQGIQFNYTFMFKDSVYSC